MGRKGADNGNKDANGKKGTREWDKRRNNYTARLFCVFFFCVAGEMCKDGCNPTHTVARVVAGRTVFLLGGLPALLHPGVDLLGRGGVGGQRGGRGG